MTIDDIVARCSKFSGWKLEYRVEAGPVIRIFQDGTPDATCSFGLISGTSLLSEVYGRLSHWGIDLEEQVVIAQLLKTHQ